MVNIWTYLAVLRYKSRLLDIVNGSFTMHLMEIILSYISTYVVSIAINHWRLLGHERSCEILEDLI